MLWLFYITIGCLGCTGTWVNPVTHIAWNCLFPLSLGGVMLGDDSQTPSEQVGVMCWCKKGPIPEPGVPLGFWEPALLVDVTRHPLCFVGMGGLDLSKNHNSFGPYRCVAGRQQAFYHVHVYTYPILPMLDMVQALPCLKERTMQVVYLSELDLLWGDDELARFIEGDVKAVDVPGAQLACAADCVAANVGLPLESLYWCGGCLGSVFPLSGTVAGVGSDVQASALMVHRTLFKLHRMGLLKGTLGKDGLCDVYPMYHMRKHQYKMQMIFPVGQYHSCQPLGRSDMLWGQGRSFPIKGEDFCYLVWRRRDCCVLSQGLLEHVSTSDNV